MSIFELTNFDEATRAKWTPISTEFYVESGYPGTLNIDHFWGVWSQLVRVGMAKWFAAVDDEGTPIGALGALFTPDPFTGNLMATEQFWFVTQTVRGSGKIGLLLFEAFERECNRQAVKTRFMGHINEHNGKTLGRFYRRKGYVPADQTFRKDLF